MEVYWNISRNNLEMLLSRKQSEQHDGNLFFFIHYWDIVLKEPKKTNVFEVLLICIQHTNM